MLVPEIRNQRILISALNWGMGHVSRCIPLIDALVNNDNFVVFAGDEFQEQIIKQYFPSLQFEYHEGYPFEFGKHGNYGLDLVKQFLPLRKRLSKELIETECLVDKYGINLVISDHRYGFKSDRVHSVILTHQLNLPVKWYEAWVQKWHHDYLSTFNEIWVPDTVNSDFAGELSKNKINLKVIYIGILSRFSLYPMNHKKTIQQVVVVSGPEIYAGQYFDEMRNKFDHETVFIVPQSVTNKRTDTSHSVYPSSNWKKCDELILKSEKIIARSGYSTLMDIQTLGVDFEITATPGQREQEYLAELWNK